MANKLRAALALLLLAILTVAGLGSGARQVFSLRRQAAAVHQSGDDLTHWSERLAPLIPYLPDRGVIGYISERDIPGMAYNATDQGEEFAMSQYVLAPRILEEGTKHELIFANIGGLSPDEVPAAVAPLGLRLERAFSFGIYLLSQAPR